MKMAKQIPEREIHLRVLSYWKLQLLRIFVRNTEQ
jgi:hypothetical protein